MKICSKHWKELVTEIEEQGLIDLCQRDPKVTAQKFNESMDPNNPDANYRENPEEYDPLMSCNYMIWIRGLQICGAELLTKDSCPICECVYQYQLGCPVIQQIMTYERSWITESVKVAKQRCEEYGLI